MEHSFAMTENVRTCQTTIAMNEKEFLKPSHVGLKSCKRTQSLGSPRNLVLPKNPCKRLGVMRAFERGNSIATPECSKLERWVKTRPDTLQDTF